MDSLVIITEVKCKVNPFSFFKREDIQDEGAGSHQGGDKDREDEEGEQEDKGSCKEDNFCFPGLAPLVFPVTCIRLVISMTLRSV